MPSKRPSKWASRQALGYKRDYDAIGQPQVYELLHPTANPFMRPNKNPRFRDQKFVPDGPATFRKGMRFERVSYKNHVTWYRLDFRQTIKAWSCKKIKRGGAYQDFLDALRRVKDDYVFVANLTKSGDDLARLLASMLQYGVISHETLLHEAEYVFGHSMDDLRTTYEKEIRHAKEYLGTDTSCSDASSWDEPAPNDG